MNQTIVHGTNPGSWSVKDNGNFAITGAITGQVVTPSISDGMTIQAAAKLKLQDEIIERITKFSKVANKIAQNAPTETNTPVYLEILNKLESAYNNEVFAAIN